MIALIVLAVLALWILLWIASALDRIADTLKWFADLERDRKRTLEREPDAN